MASHPQTGPVPSGFTRYNGAVTDSATGMPITGVCVYAGPPAGCPSPNLNTDVQGRWAIDFPSGVTWQFNFEHAYRVAIGRTGTTINLALTRK